LLGLVLDALGVQESAGDHLREALTLAEQNTEYRFNLAMFLAKIDQIDEADRIVQPLLISQPGPDVYMLLGYLRLRQHQEREAANWFQKAVDAAPNRANAWYRLGFAHHSLGEFSAAITCYRKALELDPQYFFARLQLGKVLLLQGNYADATGQLVEATRIRPTYAAAWRYLSEAQLSSGQIQAALKSAREAVVQDSTDPRNHHQLGMALEETGDKSSAAAEFQTMESLRARQHGGTSPAVDPREY
jgi:tetratricopeptide (TPR) repeat protein